MIRLIPAGAILMLALILATAAPIQAASPHFWIVESPDHGQTYAYGSEQRQAWRTWGNVPYLILDTTFTNDPYIEGSAQRRYDYFTFRFPSVRLGADHHTFYYRTPQGRSVPVASQQRDFFGFKEIRLLPNSSLQMEKPHGYLSLSLLIWAPPGDSD